MPRRLTIAEAAQSAYCEMCGKLCSRRGELKWHRVWMANPHRCALPVHPEQFTFHNLCPVCFEAAKVANDEAKEAMKS